MYNFYYYRTSTSAHGYMVSEIKNSVESLIRIDLDNLPFNVSVLPWNPDAIMPKRGQCQVHRFCGFTIAAISGSHADKLPGAKTIFWIEKIMTDEEMKQMLYNTPASRVILDRIAQESILVWENKN